MLKTLRDDQTEAVEALRSAVADNKRRICMQAPTGFGKTVLASAIANNVRAKKKKLIYTVPSISLIDQTVQMFAAQGIWEVGVIQANHHMTDWSHPIQVCSVQTLMKKETLPQADLVMIDECHKWFSFYEKWLSKDIMPDWANIPFIGLSATPWTKGLGSWFDHFHRASTTQEMIDAGHLSPFKVFAPSHPDLSQVRTVAGDYHEGELSAKMQEGTLVADAVQTWLTLWGKDKTLCYAVDRAHAKHLQQQFEVAGVRAGYIDAFTKPDERTAIKRDYHAGLIRVVVSVGTMTVGIDWDVRCISMCRPTKSDMLFVQIVGRGLRTANGKDHCLILDHSDNHHRLGFVTDIDASYTGLHVGKTPTHENRTAGIRLPKECPQCAYLKPPRMAVCPSCGFKAEVQCGVKADEGELRELKPKPKGPRQYSTLEEKAEFLAELKGHAIHKGYKSGWASNQYREKFGVWPDHSIRNIAPARLVSADTLSWIKHRLIAWAKSKHRQTEQKPLSTGTLVTGTLCTEDDLQDFR